MTCERCGERIGTYEPIWCRHADGEVSLTSRLRVRDEPEAPLSGSTYTHEACGTPQSPTMPWSSA